MDPLGSPGALAKHALTCNIPCKILRYFKNSCWCCWPSLLDLLGRLVGIFGFLVGVLREGPFSRRSPGPMCDWSELPLPRRRLGDSSFSVPCVQSTDPAADTSEGGRWAGRPATRGVSVRMRHTSLTNVSERSSKHYRL